VEREILLTGVGGQGVQLVADGPIVSPPIVSNAWGAVALHSQFWEPLEPRVRTGGVVLVNSTVFEAPLDRDRYTVIEVPATELANTAGNAMGASMVMAAAFARATGLVSFDGLVAGMRASLPPYRQQHVEGNVATLRVGWEAIEPRAAASAWSTSGAEGATV
jgi:2-oxoglutarate ferredoxin oxidoreductase subunit gamma